MDPSKRQPLTADQLATYMEMASAALHLEISVQYRAAVVSNLDRLFQLSDKLMSFPLPNDIEIAPVFQP